MSGPIVWILSFTHRYRRLQKMAEGLDLKGLDGVEFLQWEPEQQTIRFACRPTLVIRSELEFLGAIALGLLNPHITAMQMEGNIPLAIIWIETPRQFYHFANCLARRFGKTVSWVRKLGDSEIYSIQLNDKR